MDRARPFEYVYRLTANTLEELSYQEAVYDHQVLLNETWQSYVQRKGRLDELQDEHVKSVTRTWEEEEKARVEQRRFLNNAEAEGEKQIAVREEMLNQKRQLSEQNIAHLMAFEKQLLSGRIPCRHNLFVDFDDFQQLKFNLEQNVQMMAEHFLRTLSYECEEALWTGLLIIGECDRICCTMRLKDRLLREEEECRRLEEERQRAIEEARYEEERRQREMEEAERQRREAMEQAKILERKRREEERRAKARAAREKSRQRGPSLEGPLGDGSQKKVTREPSLSRTIEHSTTCLPSSRNSITFHQPGGKDLSEVLKSASAILNMAGDLCCVFAVDKSQNRAVCTYQNGYEDGSELDENCLCMLKKEIVDETSILFTSEKLHKALPTSFSDYFSSCVETLRGCDAVGICTLLNPSTSFDESLIFLPVILPDKSTCQHTFVLYRNSIEGFQCDEQEAMAKVIWEVIDMAQQFAKEEM